MKKLFVILCPAMLLSGAASAQVRVVPGTETVCLSNPSASVTFSTAEKFDIRSMKFADGKETVRPGDNVLPWTIIYHGPQGETPLVRPSCAIYKGYTSERTDSSATLVFRWDARLNYDGAGYPVEMRVTLGETSPLLAWNLSASCPEGWSVSEFNFPTIALASPDSASVITPGGWGNEYKLRRDTVYEANYPSWSASMQMMMVDDGSGVFFYSPRDYNACGKLMTVDERKGATTFTTHTVASEGWTGKDGRFEVPWTTVSARHTEGWSEAATEWYRPWALTTEWGKKKITERDIPEWMVEKDLWMRAKYLGDTTVTAVNRAIDYYGEGIAFHWYFWHNHPYDSHYPDYLPAKPEFAPIIAQVRSRNCQVMPYINGRLWDPAADSYKARNGRDASCRRPDGNLYTETYPTSMVPNTVTCPSSPIWRGIILELADSIQENLGTDGLYIDQIAAAAPYPCYAHNHPHPAGGGEFWYHAYRDMMPDLRRDHLKDGNVVFSEENAECYIPVFDILLTVNTPHSPSCRIVPLYPLIYSDRTLTCAYTYTPYTDVTKGDFRHENMQCLLYGSQLGWVDPRLLWVNDESAYEAKFLKNLTEFRKKQHDVFIGGRYVREFVPEGDNPYVNVPVFGGDYMVKGSEWISPDGRRVLYVVNSDSKAHKVTLPTGKKITMQPISAKRIDL